MVILLQLIVLLVSTIAEILLIIARINYNYLWYLYINLNNLFITHLVYQIAFVQKVKAPYYNQFILFQKKEFLIKVATISKIQKNHFQKAHFGSSFSCQNWSSC